MSELTQNCIMQDVATAGKDDWGKLRLSEHLQEHCHVSFIPWSQPQDQWFFLMLCFIFWEEAYLNENTNMNKLVLGMLNWDGTIWLSDYFSVQ